MDFLGILPPIQATVSALSVSLLDGDETFCPNCGYEFP